MKLRWWSPDAQRGAGPTSWSWTAIPRARARRTMSSHWRQRYFTCLGGCLRLDCCLSTPDHGSDTRSHVTCSVLAFFRALNGLRSPSTKTESSASATSMCLAALADAADQPRTVAQIATRATRLVSLRCMRGDLRGAGTDATPAE